MTMTLWFVQKVAEVETSYVLSGRVKVTKIKKTKKGSAFPTLVDFDIILSIYASALSAYTPVVPTTVPPFAVATCI